MSKNELNPEQDPNEQPSREDRLKSSSQNHKNRENLESGRKKGLFSFKKSSDPKKEETAPPQEEQEDIIDSRLGNLQESHQRNKQKHESKKVLGFETLLSDYDDETSSPFVLDEDDEEFPKNQKSDLSKNTEPFKSDFPLYEMKETSSFFEEEVLDDKDDDELYVYDLLEKSENEPSPNEPKPANLDKNPRLKDKSIDEDIEDFSALRNSLWENEEPEVKEKIINEQKVDDTNSPFTIDIDSFTPVDEDFVFPQDSEFQKPTPPDPEPEVDEAPEEIFFEEEKLQKRIGKPSNLFEAIPETRESLLEGIQEDLQSNFEEPFESENEEDLTETKKKSGKTVWIILSILLAVLIPLILASILLLNRNDTKEVSLIVTPISADESIHPVGLRLPGGWYFLLQTGELIDGKWEPQVAEWLSGTEVQRIVAIPWTKQLEAYILALEPGLDTQLVMNNNDLLDYTITKIEEVPRSQVEILPQTEASLVVIIFQADADERWVITCQPMIKEE